MKSLSRAGFTTALIALFASPAAAQDAPGWSFAIHGGAVGGVLFRGQAVALDHAGAAMDGERPARRLDGDVVRHGLGDGGRGDQGDGGGEGDQAGQDHGFSVGQAGAQLKA